jgi:CheY-like chemotaxis protein
MIMPVPGKPNQDAKTVLIIDDEEDIRETLRFALESCRQPIAAKGIRLIEELPSEQVLVFADPTRLTQVASNLVVNACKFTGQGGEIRVSLRKDGVEAVLRVEDTGVGIDPDLLPRVFDLFSQADTSLHRNSGGLGVGLMIAKTLVDLHGGRIEAASEGIGHGASFTVRLPLTLNSGEPVEPPLETAPSSSAPCRVLVVEDNDDSREALGAALQLLGHEVSFASSGPDAIARAAAERPQALIVDIGLPGMDGFEVARTIRRMPQLRRVRMIALSGYGSTSDKERALEAGFDHHMTKPTDVARIERLLGGRDA